MTGRRIEIQGTVQGVGFRPWVYRLAREEGLAGWVRNGSAGVTIEAWGSEDAIEAFLGRLEVSPPPAARIRCVQSRVIDGPSDHGFRIVESDPDQERRVSIPADLATCSDCRAEIDDPSDRRFGYAFTNCTNCGPRFTIALDVPYDRTVTTMAGFEMCPACRAEYENPADRRFHAQPNACADCGPSLEVVDGRGRRIESENPLASAAAALRSGDIVAVKGLGGYHLACDATSDEAVVTLRRRKRRPAKPFAVMVGSLAAAERVALLSSPERELLTSTECPIVLARARSDSELVDEVAPGVDLVGLMLPYTPLHHLLLGGVGRPLVMTSGNLSEEPMAFEDAEAVERLGPIADLVLRHDRAIATPCDDSVVRVVAGAPLVLRRSRGWVPRAIDLPWSVPEPILAVGGDLKNAFALAFDHQVVLGPHVGDLENLAAWEAHELAIERLVRFVGVEPRVVAHDLHPGYYSTRAALDRPADRRFGVQHHHAHVVSCLAEHGSDGPVLGVAFDGTGWGPDSTAWGGEILEADRQGFRRLATLRPIALLGGERAIREVWRLTLAVLDDAFEGPASLDRLPLFDAVDPGRVDAVRRLGSAPIAPVRARGCGRWFDAIAALGLGLTEARYEGEAALRWNVVATRDPVPPYGFALDLEVDPWEIDLRPTVRELVEDLWRGVTEDRLAARFHETLAAAAGEVVALHLAASERELPIVLTGGCFQNELLTARMMAWMSGRTVLRHGEVPVGDGGLAVGQAVIAAALDEHEEARRDESRGEER